MTTISTQRSVLKKGKRDSQLNNTFNVKNKIIHFSLLESSISYLKSVRNRILNLDFSSFYTVDFYSENLSICEKRNPYKKENKANFKTLFPTDFR